MKRLKSAVKHALYVIIPKRNGYSNLRVLSGPARGTVLTLDLRIEGSYWLGNYDKWIWDRISFADLVRRGAVVWDCGSYVGHYAAAFRRLVGPTGQVHAFEASTPNFRRVSMLPALNRWSNVFVHHMAIGPDHSTLEFAENLGGSSGPVGLSKTFDPGVELEVSSVQCCGVDELVRERGIAAPDFIKFDLESAEEFALHNGDWVFTTKRPTMLLEVHGPRAMAATGRFLEKYRYEAITPDQYHDGRQSMRSSADLERLGGDWHMLLCRPLS